MAERPLTDGTLRVLRVLDEHAAKDVRWGMTGNEVGHECGFRPGMAKSGNLPHQNAVRTMGVAVHVTTALTGLRSRGLVAFAPRRDELSGTAYAITEAGRRAVAAEADRVVPQPQPERRSRW